MNKKIALVTSANRGVGYGIVKDLLNHDFIVIITSRNEELGKRAFESEVVCW